jgi:hypothetical protein
MRMADRRGFMAKRPKFDTSFAFGANVRPRKKPAPRPRRTGGRRKGGASGS